MWGGAVWPEKRTENSESWSFLLLEDGRQHVPVVATLDETTDNEAEEERFDCDCVALHKLSGLDLDLLKMLIPIRGIPIEVGALLHQTCCLSCDDGGFTSQNISGQCSPQTSHRVFFDI